MTAVFELLVKAHTNKEMMPSADLQIGSRIFCDGEIGTVLYVGMLDTLEDTWVGIEWDNTSRGKHSGTHNNIQYFNTSMPNAGSFLKLKKVDIGIPCPEAVLEKYGCDKDFAVDQNFISLPQKAGKNRVIELVGLKKVAGKQSQFANLRDIVLFASRVNGSGAPGELSQLIPNVINLDLASNLLVSWADVAAIVEQLLYLETLTLNKNRLKIPDVAENFQSCFKALKTLSLCSMSYDWNQVLICAKMWPHIKHLALWANKISSLQSPTSPIFSQLHSLDLGSNPICSWCEIIKLGVISSLEELNVDNIQLESISFSDTKPAEKTSLFPKLRSVCIRNNNLSKWQDIAELNKLMNLKEIKVANNPIILSVSPETARQLVIAKIAGLEVVNGTKINQSERRGAEYDYIKLNHKEWLASGGNRDLKMSTPSEEFLMQHPTYLLLLEKHGVAEDSETKKQSSLLKNNLMSLEIVCPLIPEKPAILKKLPESMTVGKLKALLQRIYRVTAYDVKLSGINVMGGSKEMEMDNDLRQLSFYSLCDGDKICVRW